MNTNNYSRTDFLNEQSNLSKTSYRFSFSSFQKAIKSNSDLRKQIEDIVDFGLFDYALRRNTAFIQSVRMKAEAETMELMMRFTNSVDDYQKLRKMIHRNRIIRTLAIMDRKAQIELMNKFNRFLARAN